VLFICEKENTMKRFGLLAALLLTAAPVFGEVPIRSVTLFEAGLAEITRAEDPGSGGTALELTVPEAQLNDLLKSLVIRGEVNRARIRLDGAARVEDAFERLPIGPDRIGDQAELLDALKGARVTVSDGPRTAPVSGRVMGVTRPDCGGDAGCPPTLLLETEAGLLTVPLAPGRQVRIEDEGLRDRIGRALEALALAGSGSDRTVRIETDGTGDLALSYVVPAPIWKTAYRAIGDAKGRMRLQAWAVLENVTGADWDGVRLTLSSGAPKTLAADLTSRDWAFREAFEPPAPKMRAGLMEMDTFAPRAESMMAFEVAPLAPLDAGAEMADRGLDSRFTFPDPVALEAGEMISLPFLTEEVPVERTLLWRGRLTDRTGNPDLVLRVENPLPIRLPAGIMTVSDDAGYLGDAAFPVLVSGAEAEVPFGADQRVEVRERVTTQRTERRVTLSGGLLRISEREVRTVEYRISAPAGEIPAVTIRHPSEPGWELVRVRSDPAPVPDEADPSSLRFDLPAGTGLFRVEETRPVLEAVAIGDLPRERLIGLLADRIGPEDRGRLERILEARDRLDRLTAERDALLSARTRMVEDQERSRRMMEAAPTGSDMQGRFLSAILEIEDLIAETDRKVEARRAEIETAGTDLDRLLREE
jgi:hypothetical protein